VAGQHGEREPLNRELFVSRSWLPHSGAGRGWSSEGGLWLASSVVKRIGI
jgi:hypothetical protein